MTTSAYEVKFDQNRDHRVFAVTGLGDAESIMVTSSRYVTAAIRADHFEQNILPVIDKRNWDHYTVDGPRTDLPTSPDFAVVVTYDWTAVAPVFSTPDVPRVGA